MVASSKTPRKLTSDCVVIPMRSILLPTSAAVSYSWRIATSSSAASARARENEYSAFVESCRCRKMAPRVTM